MGPTNTVTVNPSKQDNAPILVTGADGYIAGVLCRELLLLGYTVHATIILPIAQLQYLQDIADASPGTVRFFTADLLVRGSFAQAMRGCRIVIHTASPFVLSETALWNAQRDLVDPAVLGTENVLLTANETPSVERIVQTSSVGAMYADASDTLLQGGNESNNTNGLTEASWNTTSTLTHQPYFLSKKMAEARAWEIAKAQRRWTLVCLNPALVLGPGLRYHASSESFRTILKLASGKYYSSSITMLAGVPNFAMPLVDVRDVAAAHLRAALDPTVPSGRYILSAANASLPVFCQWLRQKYPTYPIPGTQVPWYVLPKWLVVLLVPFTKQGVDRDTVRNNLNVKIRLDNTKSKEVLGMRYRDPAETLQHMYQQMIDAGAVKPGPRPEFVGLLLVTTLLTVGVAVGLGVAYQQ